MSQKLHFAGGVEVIVDRMFVDGGSTPQVALLGGQRMIVSPGSPPLPALAQRGKAFFFLDKNQSPVKTLKDIAVIPHKYQGIKGGDNQWTPCEICNRSVDDAMHAVESPHWKDALAFIALQQQGGKKAEDAVKKARAITGRRPFRRNLKDVDPDTLPPRQRRAVMDARAKLPSKGGVVTMDNLTPENVPSSPD